MNNIKKIGLSALAGSLVAFSASAVEMSVSGTAEVTYSSLSGNHNNKTTGVGGTTGNPFGSNTSLKFSGSGNVGWADVTLVRTINDGLGSAFLSAYQTMDMGDLGTISFDSVGGGLEGTIANDDTLPTAYEEMWNGVSSSGIGGAASNDTLGYSNSFGPVAISLAYSKGGTAASSDGSGGAELVTGSTADYHVTYTGEGTAEGLVLSFGESNTDYTDAAENNDKSQVAHVKYAYNNISMGVRLGQVVDGTAGKAKKEIQAASIAFAVNDNLSVSVGTQDTEYKNTAGANNVTEGVDAVSASYTIGAASVRGHMSEADNAGGYTGEKDEYMELSLVLAF